MGLSLSGRSPSFKSKRFISDWFVGLERLLPFDMLIRLGIQLAKEKAVDDLKRLAEGAPVLEGSSEFQDADRVTSQTRRSPRGFESPPRELHKLNTIGGGQLSPHMTPRNAHFQSSDTDS